MTDAPASSPILLTPSRWPAWAVILVMIAIVALCTLPAILTQPNNLAAIAAGSGTGSGFAFLFHAFARRGRASGQGACGASTNAARALGASMGAWMAIYIFAVVLI